MLPHEARDGVAGGTEHVLVETRGKSISTGNPYSGFRAARFWPIWGDAGAKSEIGGIAFPAVPPKINKYFNKVIFKTGKT
jgi:hypothetical protein